MARHSKNNTAGSVFTYGERQRVKHSNEWGEMYARIGADSQKKFEQCNLCLKLVEDPLICHKGHLYCKECIIENLFMQKQKIKKKKKLQKEENDKKQNSSQIEDDKQAEIENFRKVEDGIVDTKDVLQFEENVVLRNDEIKMFKDINDLKEQKKIIPNHDKAEKIKHCFWVPEKTPDIKNNNEKEISEYNSFNKIFSSKLLCPVNNDHTIKLKELVKLNLLKHETKEKFICCICRKDLSFQKIVATKNCGHVMCKKCYDEMCSKDKVCGYCNEAINSKDLIQLGESGSSFSQHNKVETNSLNPYFKY